MNPHPSIPPPPHTCAARLITEVKDLLSFDYTSLPADVKSTVTIPPAVSGSLHAVAIWVDYQLDETSRWSTFGGRVRGGVGGGTGGGTHHKQMLRFLPKPVKVDDVDHGPVLTVSGRFDVEGGCMSFDVSVE